MSTTADLVLALKQELKAARLTCADLASGAVDAQPHQRRSVVRT